MAAVDSDEHDVEADDGTMAMPLTIPRGRPKSGRTWKAERVRTTRHSDLNRVKSLKTSWSKKMEERAAKKAMKLHERELQEERAKQMQELRKRQAVNKQKKAENARKAEIFQPVKNKAKLKRMKKKQLHKAQKKK